MKLKQARLDSRITQKKLAVLAKVSEFTISDAEHERRIPRELTQYALIDALNERRRELNARPNLPESSILPLLTVDSIDTWKKAKGDTAPVE